MKRAILLLVLAVAANAAGPTSRTAAQTQPAPTAGGSAGQPLPAAEIQKKVEVYLRKLYAWGPSFQVKIGSPTDSALPGFYQVNVEVALGSDTEAAIMYISKDGRLLIRGDVLDTSEDPFAANRNGIHAAGRPSLGPASAAVTVVDFIDFQCPHCRQLDQALRELRPQYPQVRFVTKNFPLTQIHPWAMTAAIAGECAFRQNPEAFWKLHDWIFDQQDAINPGNTWDKMLSFAEKAGLDKDAFRACMASPEAKQAVEEDIREAQALRIANTPTTFVNGRRILSTDAPSLKRFLDYELGVATAPAAKP